MPTTLAPTALTGARSIEAADAPLDAASWSRAEFQRNVEPHIPRLHRLALTLARSPAEAEDLLQNALLKAYLHRASFEARGSLVAWLYGIVRYEHIEAARTAQRRRGLLESALERWSDLVGSLFGEDRIDETPESTASAKEESQILLQCLHALREPFRTTVLLCDVEELGYDDVAQITGAAIGTVKSRHARGRVMLREAFDRWQRRHEGGRAP